MENNLKDKVIAVTGGSSGIGAAIVEKANQMGAHVAVLDLNLDAAQALIDGLSNKEMKAKAYAVNVSSQSEVSNCFKEIANDLGPVDGSVNNAGISHIGTVETTTEEDMQRIFSVNVMGVYHGLQEAVAQMKGRGGSIVNMASVLATRGVPDRFAYSMCKGAVMSMTLSVAADFVDEGIRCNCVSPARVHTPFVDDYLEKNYPGQEKEMYEKLANTAPMKRMGKPEEIAELVCFLLSDQSAFMTGCDYPADGGFLNLKV